MRGRAAVAAVLLFFAVAVHAQQSRGAVDWIFLVDTSASMKKNDIFGEVQKSLKTFVTEASAGDTVSLYAFDRDASMRVRMDAGHRDDILSAIDELKPTGNRTHLGAAIAKGLDRADELRQRDDPTRARAIVLFTDGKEDVRDIANPIPIPSNLSRALASGSHIFFVSMNEHEEQLRQFTAGRFIDATDVDVIRNLAREIRKEVEPPPLPPLDVRVSPTALDFGEVEPGQLSAERELRITTNRETPLTVRLETTPHLTMAPRDLIVKPGLPATVKLQLAVGEDAKAETRRIAFEVMHASNVAATLVVKPPSLLEQLAPWIALALAILVVAALLRFRHIRQHQLEGEIEIVKPRVGDAAYVGLPTLKATEIDLSAIVPPDALNGSDARLFCRRKAGDKKVCIEATSGALRVNSIEVPATELYDADTIQIGDATLRFNRVGHERPQEDL